MRKVVSIILALTMALSCVSALAETAAFTPADSYDVGERAFNAGEVVLTPAGEGGGTINTVRYAGEEGKEGQPAPMQRAEEGKTETQRRIDGIGGFQKG